MKTCIKPKKPVEARFCEFCGNRIPVNGESYSIYKKRRFCSPKCSAGATRERNLEEKHKKEAVGK